MTIKSGEKCNGPMPCSWAVSPGVIIRWSWSLELLKLFVALAMRFGAGCALQNARRKAHPARDHSADIWHIGSIHTVCRTSEPQRLGLLSGNNNVLEDEMHFNPNLIFLGLLFNFYLLFLCFQKGVVGRSRRVKHSFVICFPSPFLASYNLMYVVTLRIFFPAQCWLC